MNLSRSKFLPLATGAAVGLVAVSRAAREDNFISRPVRLEVCFPAWSSSDITARMIAQLLSPRLGQQVIVENRTGAGTNVSPDSVVHASPDGYSLLWVTQTNAINATLYNNLDF